MFRSNFYDFSDPGTTDVAIVENRAKMTTLGTKNIPTQFVVQFLSFPVSTVQKLFGQILTNFSDSYDSVLHSKHTHTFWGAISIVSR